jgi:predicted RNA-binding protein YlqC (UPF0109 family)
MAKEFDQEFAETLVKEIVGNPGAVSIERTVDDRGILLTLTVDPEDVGYVIGRQGSTAKAIRTLLKAIGARSDARINFKINQPGDEQM